MKTDHNICKSYVLIHLFLVLLFAWWGNGLLVCDTEKWSLAGEKQQCELRMDLKEEGLGGWHGGVRRLFKGHGKAHTKDDGRSAWMEKWSRKHINNNKRGIEAESNNLDMKNPSLVKGRQGFQMKREKPEAIVRVLWPSGNWEKGKGRWEAEYCVHQTKVTTTSKGEKIWGNGSVSVKELLKNSIEELGS